MSEIGLNINVDSYNNEGIKTIKGNNNAEIYKLYILKNKRRLSLVGKTVKLGYVMAGTTKGDIIEDLNITNAEQGEITFPITNKISKQDGVYSCQLAIYGADEFLEYTATFGLTVEDNIFTKIAGEIENSKDLTYIERILEEAKIVSGDLKTNIPVATNLNSSLESNISNARNINTTLADTTEKSKVAATDAIEKKSQLEKSIAKAKEFIDGLDGSQNIPQLRLDVTELQNGLKSNQALEYNGSSINAENTLEGRTAGMIIEGRTLVNLGERNLKKTPSLVVDEPVTFLDNYNRMTIKLNVQSNKKITINRISDGRFYTIFADINNNRIAGYDSWVTENIKIIIVPDNVYYTYIVFEKVPQSTITSLEESKFIVLEGEWTNKDIPSYFEGIKSFGEAEQEGDKYKISILSSGKNLVDFARTLDTLKVQYTLNNGVYSLFTYGQLFTNGIFTPKTNNQITLSCKVKLVTATRFRIDFVYDDGFNASNICDSTDSFTEVKIVSNPSRKLKYVRFNHSQAGDIKIKDLLIEESSTQTSYEPYISDKKDILIKEPLRSVGDVCDVLYEDNGQVKVYRKLGKYTFTGDENFVQLTNDNNSLSVYVDMNNSLSILLNGIAICNNFNYLAPNDLVNKYLEGISISGSVKNRFLFRISTSKLSTPNIEGFKAWLKANPTEIIYPITTPTTEIVENCVDIDLDTYQEKTYFNILNSLPGTLDFKVPSNIGSLVQSNAKEINNINEFINNFILKALLEMNKDLATIKIKNGLN